METAINSTEISRKDRQKEEALLRLKLMDVPTNILCDFEQNGHCQLCTSPLGFYSEPNDETRASIKAFEEEYEATVYMVVRIATRAGLLDSLLYVGKYEDEWEEEKLDIQNGYVMTYTINHDHDFCSEFGSIVYARTELGGIIRLN